MYHNSLINLFGNFDVDVEVNTRELKFGIFYAWERGDGIWFGITVPMVSISLIYWFKNGPSAR